MFTAFICCVPRIWMDLFTGNGFAPARTGSGEGKKYERAERDFCGDRRCQKEEPDCLIALERGPPKNSLRCMDGIHLCTKVHYKHFLDLSKIHPEAKITFSGWYVHSIYLLRPPNLDGFVHWERIRTGSQNSRAFSMHPHDYAGCILILSDPHRKHCTFVKVSDVRSVPTTARSTTVSTMETTSRPVPTTVATSTQLTTDSRPATRSSTTRAPLTTSAHTTDTTTQQRQK